MDVTLLALESEFSAPAPWLFLLDFLVSILLGSDSIPEDELVS